jgi:hypothetical protein
MEGYKAFRDVKALLELEGGHDMICTGVSLTAGWSVLGPAEYCVMRKDGKELGKYHPTWRGGGFINAHAVVVGYRCETSVSLVGIVAQPAIPTKVVSVTCPPGMYSTDPNNTHASCQYCPVGKFFSSSKGPLPCEWGWKDGAAGFGEDPAVTNYLKQGVWETTLNNNESYGCHSFEDAEASTVGLDLDSNPLEGSVKCIDTSTHWTALVAISGSWSNMDCFDVALRQHYKVKQKCFGVGLNAGLLTYMKGYKSFRDVHALKALTSPGGLLPLHKAGTQWMGGGHQMACTGTSVVLGWAQGGYGEWCGMFLDGSMYGQYRPTMVGGGLNLHLLQTVYHCETSIDEIAYVGGPESAKQDHTYPDGIGIYTGITLAIALFWAITLFTIVILEDEYDVDIVSIQSIVLLTAIWFGYGCLFYIAGAHWEVKSVSEATPGRCSQGTFYDCVARGNRENGLSSVDCDCFACPLGKFSSTSGAESCLDCQIGQFQQVNRSSCDHCPAGLYSGAGSLVCSALCPSGKYGEPQVLQDVTEDQVCHNCPAGQYQALNASAKCAVCPNGKFQSTQGGRACFACPAGNSQPSTAVCSACPAGQYQEQIGRAICKECPSGTFTSAAGENAVCTEIDALVNITGFGCPNGTKGTKGNAMFVNPTLSAVCVSCPVGQFSFWGAGVCLCPSGTWSHNGVCQPSTCDIGYFTPAGSTASHHCDLCPQNKFKDSTMAKCEPTDCAKGLNSAPGASTSDKSCQVVKTCEVNKKLDPGTGSCLCINGFYEESSNGTVTCRACPAGTACPGLGTQKASITILPDYWRTGENSTTVLKCPSDGACVGSEAGDCKTGHQGHLCMVCADGYAHSYAGCSDCSGGTEKIMVTTGLTVGVLLVLILLVRKYSAQLAEKGFGAKTKIVISFVQTVNQITHVYSIPYPKMFLEMMAWFDVLNLDFVKLAQLDCFAAYGFYDQLFFMTLMPAGTFGAIGLAVLWYYRQAANAGDSTDAQKEQKRQAQTEFYKQQKIDPESKRKQLEDFYSMQEKKKTGTHVGKGLGKFGQMKEKAALKWDQLVEAVDTQSQKMKIELQLKHPKRTASMLSRKYKGSVPDGWENMVHEPKEQAQLRAREFTKLGLFFSFIVFPGVSTAIFKVFPCFEFDDGQSLLKADLRVSCGDSNRSPMLAYAIAMIVCFPLGIPLSYLYLLRTNKPQIEKLQKDRMDDRDDERDQKKGRTSSRSRAEIRAQQKPRSNTDEERTRKQAEKDADEERAKNQNAESMDFLFKEYEERCWWFEVYVCFNRLMTTGGTVAFKEGSAMQVATGMLITVVSIFVYALNTPFINNEDDVLAVVAQWSVFFTLFSGLLLKLNVTEQDQFDEGGDAFGYFLVLVNGLVLVTAFGAFVFELSRNPKPEGLIATASVKLKSLRSSISNRFSMSERSLPSDTKKEAVANPVNQHGAQMTQIEMTSAAAGTV